MLIRDFFSANAQALVPLWHELVKGERQVIAFLIDHHPIDAQHITSDVIIGCGWDDHPDEGRGPYIRWFGDGFSPSGCGSSLVHDDPEVAMVLFSNRMARAALILEKKQSMNVWCFAQAHIKTIADSEKLFRYMGNYHQKPATT